MVQGGDVTRGRKDDCISEDMIYISYWLGDGSGGDSIYNGKFNDEKPGLAKKFDSKGLLAMANSGKMEMYFIKREAKQHV
jgi:cyclophilin family peptidyl-prolyl cis-trans isomerase